MWHFLVFAPERFDLRAANCSVFVCSVRITEETRLCKAQVPCEKLAIDNQGNTEVNANRTLATKKRMTEQISFHNENARVIPQRRKKGM